LAHSHLTLIPRLTSHCLHMPYGVFVDTLFFRTLPIDSLIGWLFPQAVRSAVFVNPFGDVLSSGLGIKSAIFLVPGDSTFFFSSLWLPLIWGFSVPSLLVFSALAVHQPSPTLILVSFGLVGQYCWFFSLGLPVPRQAIFVSSLFLFFSGPFASPPLSFPQERT